MTSRSKRKGYIILEFLTSLQMGAVVIVAAVILLGNVIRLNHAGLMEAKEMMQIEKLFQTVQQDMDFLVDYDFSGSVPGEKAFVGRSSSMKFFRTVEGGVEEIMYRIEVLKDERTASEECVVKRAKRDIREILSMNPWMSLENYQTVFASSCDMLRFRYGEKSGDNSIVWTDVWEHDRVPSWVELQVPLKMFHAPGQKLLRRLFSIPIQRLLVKENT